MQNQAAAQKLLQKLNHPNQDDRRYKGRRHRGKGREEDPVVFTLEEYENRKAQVRPSDREKPQDIGHDEELARQLQNQFNLEDSRVSVGFQNCAVFVFLPFSLFFYLCNTCFNFLYLVFRYQGALVKRRHRIFK